MAGTIILSDIEQASNADILAGTRLQTVPAGGFLTFEILATDSDGTNFFTTSIQLPGGDTPLEGIRVPASRLAASVGNINADDKLMATFPVGQGGHTVFGVTENGTTNLAWRVTYSPANPTM